MKKSLIRILMISLLLLIAVFAFAEDRPSPSTTGALKVTGTQLTDLNGKPVLLRGISTHGLAWFPQYVNTDCFRDLHDRLGCNIVRLAMYTDENGGYCTDGDPLQLKELIRSGVQSALDADMYVIIDWHILRDNDPNLFADSAIEFFEEMSAEFADCKHVLYEICNEPNGETTWTQIAEYANRVIPVIRSNDPDSVILVGTPDWSKDITAPADDMLDYENIMYSMHFYTASHGQWLREETIEALEAGIPVFVTEYGVCSADGNGSYDFKQADLWADMLEEHGISSCMWNISNKDELSAIFKPEYNDTSGFTKDDLTEGGQWLATLLGGSLGGERIKNTESETEEDTDLLSFGMKGSWIDESNSAKAQVIWEGNDCRVHIDHSGKERWHVQPSVSGLKLEQGKTYTVSFTIQCDRDIIFESYLQKNYDPYSAYGGSNDYTAGKEEKDYRFSVTMPKDEKNASLVFNIGKNEFPYNVTITAVTLTEE